MEPLRTVLKIPTRTTMNVCLPPYDESAMGGGWSFIYNFRKAMGDAVTNYEMADVFFIPSASMVSRDDVEKARSDGKKIVLRCDNIIRNSRNRNTGMSRMKDFSDWADLVIFQSKFAEELLNPYLNSENFTVILNSTDTDIFNPTGRSKSNTLRYLYSKHSSDETKNWEMARVAFQIIYSENPNTVLNLVGRFDTEEYNFDFYNGESYRYFGQVNNKHGMADIYKSSDVFLYTYFNDACSNTLIEALCSGMKIDDPWGMLFTGGSKEICTHFKKEGINYFGLERMASDYKEAFGKL